MGWSNSTFQLLIITASPSGFSGLFVYSPAPGPANLIASIAATSGTDPYGNAYLAGIAAYQTGGTATYAQVNNGSLALKSVASGSIALLQVRPLAPFIGWLGFSGATGYVFDKGIVAEGNVLAQNPQSPFGPEVWHVIGAAGQPTFGAGFAAAGFVGAVAPAFQLEPINGGRVILRGDVALTANQVQGAGIVTLPAAYQTATVQQFFNTVNNLSGYSISTGSIVALAAGVVAINCSGTNGNFVSLDGIVIELD